MTTTSHPNMNTQRKIASWILLSVFVPMLFLASLHVHIAEAGEGDCVACAHHSCGGHFGEQEETAHDCVLCQFLSLPYLAVAVSAVILFNHEISKTLLAQIQSGVRSEICGIVGLRAPPAASFVA